MTIKGQVFSILSSGLPLWVTRKVTEITIMNWTKILQIGLGTALLCLVLAGILFLPALGQEIDVLGGQGEGDSDLYLPLMVKPFMLPDVVIGRVSLDSAGTEGNDASAGASISADGRYVTFVSFANNLVSGDSNGRQDVFVHDRADGQTWRVSAASDGTEGNNVSAESTIAADGRYGAFSSFATNLVSSDTNARSDIFVHGLQSGQTSRVSVTSTGAQVSGDSEWPALSADGRYVAFQSSASNLVADDSNGFIDVFVHDRQSGETTLVSMASGGTQGNQRSLNPPFRATAVMWPLYPMPATWSPGIRIMLGTSLSMTGSRARQIAFQSLPVGDKLMMNLSGQ